MKNIAQVNATARPVYTLRATRLRCGDSTHTPTSGASTATVKPASAPVRPNQLAGEVPPDIPTPTLLVRYTEKTKVATIAFRPVDPQSHSAHATT
jgi:hypothetical protein